MKAAELRQLRHLARLHGVQSSYADMEGKKRNTSTEALMRVLGALGVPARNAREVRAAIGEHTQQQHAPGVEPVIVAWNGRKGSVCVRFPARHIGSPFRAEIRCENGESVTLKQLKRQRTAALAETVQLILELPDLSFGYHELHFQIANFNFRSWIISAPQQSYSNPELAGSWGLFAPLYALHSKSSWSAGNFTDWCRLGDWTRSLGGKVLGTLPLLGAFLDHPFCEPGPYSPASRMFWNEFYVDIERIPEFKSCQRLPRSFRDGARLIDYPKQWAIRRRVLEQLSGHFFRAGKSARQQQFQRFLANRPDCTDYAQFRAVCDRIKRPWTKWPAGLRRGRMSEGDFSESAMQFHQYVQWIAQEQVSELIEHATAGGWTSYLDLPVGVNAASYDVWKNQSHFALEASVGAPPDPTFPCGQDWGFPPLHPQRIRENRYDHILQFLRFQMRHSGILRVDHVMGLHRLYWISRDAPATEGAYVAYREDELYAILCLESHRHQTVLAGENLGTVPPEVNKRMARHQLRETFVVQYAVRPGPKKPLKAPPKTSVASLNTHDMPTFASFVEGRDIDDRAALGFIPKKEVAREHRQRRKLVEALGRFLRRKTQPGELLCATLEWLARSQAEIVLVALEDLWLEKEPQNVPATSTERPNWRRKMPFSLEEIEINPALRALLSSINQLRKRA